MTLSLCMIVKNESETLDRCLSHARPYVDEIVIVDTGSTDGTKEIARRYADIFDEIEWPNSFAIARNHSFDLATADYILVLDGDEYIPDPTHWEMIRDVIQSDRIASVQLRVRNELGANKLMAADRMWQERIFRNVPQLLYTGRVHNQIETALNAYLMESGTVRMQRPAEIIHTGYALETKQMKLKYKPRLELLKAEYREASSGRYRAYYGYQLGVVLFILERFEDAHRIFGELEYSALSEHNGFYTHLLAAHVSMKVGDSERALIHCNGMLNLTRTEPIAYYSTGLALIHAGNASDGLFMLMGAYDVIEEVGDDARFVVNTQMLLDRLAHLCERGGIEPYARGFAELAAHDDPSPRDIQRLMTAMKLGLVNSQQAEAA